MNLQMKNRNEIYQYAISNKLEFYDLKNQTGLLRQLMIRSNVVGEFMIVFQFGQIIENQIVDLLEFVKQKFLKYLQSLML